MPSKLALPVAYLVGAVGGALIGFSYAPFGVWPFAIIGVALLCWATNGRRTGASLGIGFVAGAIMNAISIGWISVLGTAVGVALVAFMSLWTMLLGWVLSRVQRLPLWPVWAASSVVAVELGASSVPFGGFGWNRLAFTTGDQPLSGYLPWIGVAGVSWLVALCGALLLVVVVGEKRRIVAACIVAGLFIGGGLLKLVPISEPDEKVTIGIVQGNVDGIGHGAPGYARSVTNNHLSETITLMAKARTGKADMPDFVLWPENSTDIDPTLDAETRKLVELSSAIAGVPIFVGAVMDGPGPDERQTTGLWWVPSEGVQGRYDKRNLVPFGEWIPFRDVLLPRLPILKQIGRQGVPGTEPGVLTVEGVEHHPGLRIGDVICFELAYDSTVYDTVRHGAQVIVVQSNNATYTFTGQPHQQFEMTRIRAMESRREFVVATTSSFSGLIEPDGHVSVKTDEATATSLTVTVPLRSGETLGVALQPWLPIALALVAVGAVAASFRVRAGASIDRQTS